MKRFFIMILTALLIFAALPAASFGARAENTEKRAADELVFHDGWNTRDQHRVFYEIFVGSFSDSDGDGTGDLRGIINRMDYLNDGDPRSGKSLGIEGIWLTPVFLSPSYHKYDVTDYYTIDPAFGTLADLQELIALCHERDVKLILDLPLNHTGNGCRWYRSFLNAHRTRNTENEYYNFYSWLDADDPVPAGRHFDPVPGMNLRVETNFSSSMPELDFDQEKVQEAVLSVARYYLDLGVDGFRFDAAKYLYLNDHDKNLSFWTWYTDRLKEINPDVYTVAEVWDGDGITNRYAACMNCFRFSGSQAEGLIAATARGGDVNRFTRETQQYLDSLHAVNPRAMNIPFISNHDMDRAAGYLSAGAGRMQMAANLYLLSPGSPFIYYGEETGLRGSRGGENTDANRRLAMRWGDGDTVRDPAGSTYARQIPDTVADMLKQEESLPNHYIRVMMVRKANPEIARGTYTALSFPDTRAGGFVCEWNGSRAAVLHNTTEEAQILDLSRFPDMAFTEISAVLECLSGLGGASLEGGVLTLGPLTTAVLR